MDASTPPERMGQYEIVGTLGLGSIWRTYKGFDPILRRNVTLKAIPKGLLSSHGPAATGRLQAAVRAATGLKHPGIARVFGYDEDAESVFLVTEYVEGRSLTEGLKAPVGDAVALAVQLLEALDYAHAQGVLHRALKPSQLLLTGEGRLKITDFAVPRLDTGTSNYMSPEQLIRAQVDGRSDVFSAGVVFYELLTGVNPFAGTPQDLINRVCNDKERHPSEISAQVPSVFDPVCAKALAKLASDRYMTARAFCDDIRGAFESAFHTPPSTMISPETIAGAARRLVAQPSGSAPQSESKAPSSAGSGWDEGSLREIEKHLAAFIGPLAGVIVQKAASRAKDLDQLYLLAAESLEREEERRAFLAGRAVMRRSPTPGRPPEALPPAPKSDSPAKAMPGGSSLSSEPRPVPKPQPQPELKPAKPDLSAEARPAPESEPQSSAAPGTKSSLAAAPKPEPKAEAKPRPMPPQPPADVADRLEELLGKQPENLSGYLKDSPAQVEGVIHAFLASVEALAAAYAAKSKIEPLTPQSISFDRMGKATLRAARPATHGTGGVVSNPRYAAPEVFAEKSGAEATNAGADVYALGLMFYEILLGKTLFEKSFADQQSDLDWLSWHADLEKKAPSLKSVLPDCPAALSDLLESMMEKHPEKRMTDVEAILQRLRSIAQRANKTVMLSRPASPRRTAASTGVAVAPEPVKTSTHTPSRQGKKSGKRLALVLLLLIVIVCGVLVWLEPGLYRELVMRLR